MTKGHRPLQYTGVRSPKPPNIVKAKRDPTASDTAYITGDIWINTSTPASWEFIAGFGWLILSRSQIGSIDTITGNSGGPETPLAGNFNILGTGSITVAGSPNTETVQLTGLTNHAVLVGAGTATITKLAIGATGQALMGATGADPAWTGSPSFSGSVTAATSITATNGNLVMGTAGNKIIVPTGSNASAGTSAAMSGTPGTITVATTACSATAKVFYARATAGGTLGNVSISAQDGTGFTLLSTGNETSTFNWWIINA